ncbi:hypothetical protein JOB18_022569 [Solea senegalensis]|uniref:Uncharacterized protein n=1 Tax=Solea senegalensis TaxID=28829 RepID=A0AAV6SB05_SOLSE|nr:hypothetical protein JOB18_022569 [Solea senegalensis]
MTGRPRHLQSASSLQPATGDLTLQPDRATPAASDKATPAASDKTTLTPAANDRMTPDPCSQQQDDPSTPAANEN